MRGLYPAGPEMKIKLGRKPGNTGQWAWREVSGVWSRSSTYQPGGKLGPCGSPSKGLWGPMGCARPSASVSSAILKAGVKGMALTRSQVPGCRGHIHSIKSITKAYVQTIYNALSGAECQGSSPNTLDHLAHTISVLCAFLHSPRMRIRLVPSS